MAGITGRRFLTGVNTLSRRGIRTGTVTCAMKSMNDPLEHATGLEKQELLAMAAGNENPFDMRVFKRTSGEVSNPTLVPSSCKTRLIGCICHEDSTSISWMWLTQGEPKRCECGYFFKLVQAKPMVP